MQQDQRLAPLIAECRRRRAAGADDASLMAWLRGAVPPDLAAEAILQAALDAEAAEADRSVGSESAARGSKPGPQPMPGVRTVGSARSFGRRPDFVEPGRRKPDVASLPDREDGAAHTAGSQSRSETATRNAIGSPPEGADGGTAPPAQPSVEPVAGRPDDESSPETEPTGDGEAGTDGSAVDRFGDDSSEDPARRPAALDSVRVRESAGEPSSPADHVPLPPRRESEAELAQAARQLGIRFRDSENELVPDLPGSSRDEVVRKLGIRFRDDDLGPGFAAGLDPSLEAERLGIRFREPGDVSTKSSRGFAKYWFWVLLAVALTIIMPVLVQSVGPFVAHLSD